MGQAIQPNGSKFGCPLDTAPMPVVTVPTLAIIMSGYARLQIPASKEVQALFVFFPPALKAEPWKNAQVLAEAQAVTQKAGAMIGEFLQKNPGLKPMADQIMPSYADVNGRLFYTFLMPLRTY